ncbi:hypothetical protein DY023_07525 [Microbacterium bovistercoris]|uniref:Barstar (barnase inhibitor) domain-containing protein n=2 Tax=Microbacterium bovistercoris TaxID=2293570 RepID=A0A371NV04_9MICO|nr:hypothetical protein DY023_07525 [Microbacterium bovistercoris]
MRDTPSLMSEFGAALQFFDDFGENWYALEECLCYLDEWLPADAYVLVVERSEEILSRDDDGLRALMTTINAAGSFWSKPVIDGPEQYRRPARPFHVLMLLGEGQLQSSERLLRAAEAVGVRVLEGHSNGLES